MTDPIYLDYLCADWAGKLRDDLAKKVNKPVNHVQKSLGILQEDGLYAFGVYQNYREKEGGAILGIRFTKFLTQNRLKDILFPGGAPATDAPFLMVLKQLTGQSLAQIFLARDLILRVLVYTYYHLRADEKKPEQD